MLTILGFTFGFIELGLAIVLLPLLLWAVYWDRKYYSPQPKWYGLGLALVAVVVYLTLGYDAKKEAYVWNFAWINVALAFSLAWHTAAYLGLGIVYSCVEFYYELQRSVKSYTAAWAVFKAGSIPINWNPTPSLPATRATRENKTFAEWLALLKMDEVHTKFVLDELVDQVRRFCRDRSDAAGRNGSPFQIRPLPSASIGVNPKLDIEAYTDKGRLVKFLGAWIVFWPFYGLTLIFGDFLEHLLSGFAGWIVKRSKAMVDNAFRGAFNRD